MILAESNKATVPRFCLSAFLMYENIPVEKVEIKILRTGLYITPIEILAEELVPYPVRNHSMNLLSWLTARGFLMNTHRNIFFTELPLTLENRDPRTPIILSLTVNAVSLTDKYWLNPNETTEFSVNGANILFEKKMWDNVDPFRNLYKPGLLEEYALNDIFIEKSLSGIPAKSLLWSTSGAQNKRWLLDGTRYYLEKKLMKEDFDNEIQTFEFFANTPVIIPEYSGITRVLDHNNEKDFNSFSLDTLDEGLFIVQKRCLTDVDSHLVRLCDYIEFPRALEQAVQTMCSSYNVSEEDINTFISLIAQYQKQFEVPVYLMNTKNMGLLVTKQGAHPVVWGRLKLKLDWTGQIIE